MASDSNKTSSTWLEHAGSDLRSIKLLLENQNADQFEKKFCCEARDIFSGRLDTFFRASSNALLTAIVGELGNNAFDHNLGHWKTLYGVYFNAENPGLVLLVDRGQGIKNSLKKVQPQILTDVEALEIAFTKKISGRSPEQRGNGLKFVASSIIKNNYFFHFQSGRGVCEIHDGKLVFFESAEVVEGCLAILRYAV